MNIYIFTTHQSRYFFFLNTSVMYIYIYIYSCVLHGRYIRIHERMHLRDYRSQYFSHTRVRNIRTRDPLFFLSPLKNVYAVCGTIVDRSRTSVDPFL